MTNDFATDYDLVAVQLASLLDGERDALANTANFVALLFDAMPQVNWLGVYLLRDGELVLGPFQGKPACTRIPLGQGVCGTAAASREVQRIGDVHAFDGHIACDPDSRSELVVPLIVDDRVIGVLDIDSPFEGRFSAADQRRVEHLCTAWLEAIGTAGAAALVAT